MNSITVNTYDLENNTTTINWAYKKREMEDILNYLKNLSGVKTETINTKDTGDILYSIDLDTGNPYTHILFAGNYAITDKGEYYLVDKEEAEKVSKSFVGNTRVLNLIYIYNHRYLSLLNGKWNTKHMMKSRWNEKQQVDDIQLKSDKAIVNKEDDKFELDITNNSSSKISFGTKLELEALVDDVWYNIDDMINENVNLGWTLELITLNTGESYQDDFNHLRYYQPLPEGRYRLIKEITMNETKSYVAYEFDVS